MPWSEAKQHADYVREHGIEQFLKIWHRLKDRTGDVLLWGDEVRLAVLAWSGTYWGGSGLTDSCLEVQLECMQLQVGNAS